MALSLTLLAGLALSGLPALAQTPAQTQVDLYTCQIRQHELLATYHIFSADPGDPVHRGDVQSALGQAAACAALVQDDLKSINLAPDAETVRSRYGNFERLFKQNYATVAKKGAPEFEVLGETVEAELQMVAGLDAAASTVQSTNKLHPRPAADTARHMAVLIQYATARYVERTTAAGGSAIRDDSKEPTIDDLAQQFGKGLQQLRSFGGNAEMNTMLASIVTKWRFIQGSLLNYNQKTVPFTVNRHGRALSEMLIDYAAKADGSK
jgi:hypothetical protein